MLRTKILTLLATCGIAYLGFFGNAFAISEEHTSTDTDQGAQTYKKSAHPLLRYQEIHNLLAAHNAEAAFAKATEISATEMGKPEFDLLYGNVALAADKNAEAMLAFQRVVINERTFDLEAHIGLIYALYKLNDLNAANAQMASLNKIKTSQEINAAAEELKKNLAGFIVAAKGSFEKHVYAKLTAGYNDNVNSSAGYNANQYLALIGFNLNNVLIYLGPNPGFTDPEWQAFLDATNQYNANLIMATTSLFDQLRHSIKRIRAYYFEPLLGFNGGYTPASGKFVWHWDVSADQTQYIGARNYDAGQANFSTNLDYSLGKSYFLNAAFYYQSYIFDNHDFRQNPIGELGVSRYIGSNNVIKLYANLGLLSYPGNSTSNVDLYSGALQWTIFDSSQKNLLITQFQMGDYHSRNERGKFNGSNFYVANANAMHKITQRLNITAGVMYQNYLYAAEQFADIPRRQDNYWRYTAGVNFEVKPGWALSLTGAHTNNRSNIFLYQYDQNDVEFTISYIF